MDKNFRITISYDGTKYLGWQRQNTDNDKTIQGKLENILSKMAEEKIEIIGSGRTDAGVHARMQVANFHWETKESAKNVKSYLNKYLPEDIVITEVKEVSDRFHSRYNVKSKTYLYRIFTKSEHPIFERKYVYHLGGNYNLEKMKEAAALLIGEHDFKGFSSKNVKKSTIRNIYDIDIEQTDREILIYIKANGFLYNMVRIIVGTLIEIGLNEREVKSIYTIFEQKDRAAAGITVPAQGLILYDVEY
ncbi:MAG: tRNA pseudouridine(38-40) synthase TruA [Firmicutes bacterium HGW-Firmicutes-1]|jgi:tRNA pseudouridine38-40 synthase|nr:MAG: tRNA pseudouridine(38-40) synthase TruA [Firmicutes bacterium HGW-Firmicutes-1]